MNTSKRAGSLSLYAQHTGMLLVISLAIVLTCATLGAFLGFLPWPQLSVMYGDAEVVGFGKILQIGLTLLSVVLLTFLPAASRATKLISERRDFRMSMEDVAMAYTVAHASDREGIFTLSREFDDVRARIEHMRQHPDLRGLEGDVIELAAQMSHEARDLAQVYSAENITRAREFLRQRQEELTDYERQIGDAQRSIDELKRWKQALSVEDATIAQSRARLEGDLREVLEPLGLSIVGGEAPKVVSMASEKVRQSTKSDSGDTRPRGAISGTGQVKTS